MSCCLKAGFSVSGPIDIVINKRAKGSFMICNNSLQFKDPILKDFGGNLIVNKPLKLEPVYAQSANLMSKSQKWWEKSLHPNMIEIESAQQLVDYLTNSGDRLVIVDFYSPGCGGCKALHPKICQMAEMNQDALFLKVNYEQHKPMCYALHVHVLPFFRFYRGAQGRVCSFSCTNATIKKFKDALAKHGTERCSLGPAKGLEESELLALASIDLISKDLVPNQPKADEKKVDDLVLNGTAKTSPLSSTDDKKMGLKEGNAMVMA